MSGTATPPTVGLLTYRQAERVLGIERRVLSELVDRLGITPKPVPWNGRGKGLDLDDLARIKRAWSRLRRIA